MAVHEHGNFDVPLACPSRAGAWSGPGPRGYRNLFGPTARGDRFKGGAGEAGGEEISLLLDKIARSMAVPYRWPDGSREAHNSAVPAGYVYLAQLVAHDLTFLSSIFPVAGNGDRNVQNLRTLALNLDTLYGGGPVDKPFAYSRPKRKGAPRQLLRLGVFSRGESRTDADWMPDRKWARDLPRVASPFLNDHEAGCADELGEVLIADPRNDDQPILAQLVVLFQMLHNLVCDRLTHVDQPSGNKLTWEDHELFPAARRVVSLVYTEIIRHDLMRRLLSPAVFERYNNNPDALLEDFPGPEMPVEFSHAAFRVGHYMISPAYRLNSTNRYGIRDILQTNSSSLPRSMPLHRQWALNWSNFFELSSTPPEFSRKIAPYAIGILFDRDTFGSENHGVGSLPHRDLLRGASVGMRSVASLADKMPPTLKANSPMLNDPQRRTQVVADWLRMSRESLKPDEAPSDDEVGKIASDPPLLLYLLLEAATEEAGTRLGTLGSVIVGEVIYRALGNAADGSAAGEEAEAVFGGPAPSTMPQMIQWIATTAGLTDPQYDFVADRGDSAQVY